MNIEDLFSYHSIIYMCVESKVCVRWNRAVFRHGTRYFYKNIRLADTLTLTSLRTFRGYPHKWEDTIGQCIPCARKCTIRASIIHLLSYLLLVTQPQARTYILQ